MALAPKVLELLKSNGQEHVLVFIGGIIPDEDIVTLKEMGVSGIYGPGTTTEEIINDISKAVAQKSK